MYTNVYLEEQGIKFLKNEIKFHQEYIRDIKKILRKKQKK